MLNIERALNLEHRERGRIWEELGEGKENDQNILYEKIMIDTAITTIP